MRVFVTGSTGYLGSAIVQALVKARHEVGALYRNPSQEAGVRAAGAVPIFGNLKDIESYQHFAATCQAVIHAGFESSETDQIAVEDLIGALKAEGEQNAFIYTSGVWTVGETGANPVDESVSTDRPGPFSGWRAVVERQVLEAATPDFATAVIRPGMLYGGSRGGWITRFLETAQRQGAAEYIGSGANHWAMAQPDDVAQLYRLVAEKRARGVFHAVDGSHPTTLEIARVCSTAIGKGGAVQSKPVEGARTELGPLVDVHTLNQVVVARRSKELGWVPAHKPCLESIPAAVQEWVH